MIDQDPSLKLRALNPLAAVFQPRDKVRASPHAHTSTLLTKAPQGYRIKIEITNPGEEERLVDRMAPSQLETSATIISSMQQISGRISILPSDLLPPCTKHNIDESIKLFGNGIAGLSTKPQKPDASATESSKTLAKFHPFPRMPSELRLKIWKLNMPGPRVVELRYSEKVYHAVSPTQAPTLLHVCREVSLLYPSQRDSNLLRIYTAIVQPSHLKIACVNFTLQSRAEAIKHYTLLFDPHWLTPRVFINPQIDTLYFSEKRGGEFDKVFEVGDSPYINYFKTMTKNINTTVLQNLHRVAINDGAYLGNIEWDHEREDVFYLTKFTNLNIAAAVLDAGNKVAGPVKLVQVTWGACPVHTEYGRSQPDYDGDEVLHSCNLCGCPFIKELLEELEIDHIYFEQLERGLRTMFSNFEKDKLPGWKVPKTKTMALAEKQRDVKLGQFEFHFRAEPKPVPRGASRASLRSSEKRRCSF
jgi:hypothetical protein